MMTKRARFLATFSQEDDATWYAVVRVGPKETAFSCGDTLEECRANTRDSVEGLIESDAFDLEEVVATGAAAEAVQEYFLAKDELDAATARSRQASTGVALALTSSGVSMRRVGEILGLTGARVHQLVSDGAAAQHKAYKTKSKEIISAKGGRAHGGNVRVKTYRDAKTGKILEPKRARPKTA